MSVVSDLMMLKECWQFAGAAIVRLGYEGSLLVGRR